MEGRGTVHGNEPGGADDHHDDDRAEEEPARFARLDGFDVRPRRQQEDECEQTVLRVVAVRGKDHRRDRQHQRGDDPRQRAKVFFNQMIEKRHT